MKLVTVKRVLWCGIESEPTWQNGIYTAYDDPGYYAWGGCMDLVANITEVGRLYCEGRFIVDLYECEEMYHEGTYEEQRKCYTWEESIQLAADWILEEGDYE